MKKLPVGIQDFADIIRNDYLYIDKTEYVYKLLQAKYYFLSRPRRFGKSVLISTLKEFFSGKKELFKNLWIYDKVDWKKHPIIHIDFSKSGHKVAGLEKAIDEILKTCAKAYQIELSDQVYPLKFNELITKLSEKEKLVLLIDEYDKPIIDFLENPEKAEENREILRNLFSVIKGNDANIRFCFITGVSKFAKVSVFSELNNLYDITLSHEFASITGYTQNELETYFEPQLSTFPAQFGISRPELLGEIKKWYNGFSWNGTEFVYNPFSMLCFFRDARFQNYWFETGTPTFLLKLLRKQNYEIPLLENSVFDSFILSTYDLRNISVIPLLFQTGYITIKNYNRVENTYTFDFPNFEVKNSLLQGLFTEFSEKDLSESMNLLSKITESLKQHNISQFIEYVKALYAGISYHLVDNKEKYYHSLFYMILKLLGFNVNCEIETNVGRIDAVVSTPKQIYIIEFKVGTATEALLQIRNKNYAQKFIIENKPIYLLGIGFDSENKNIGSYKLEQFST